MAISHQPHDHREPTFKKKKFNVYYVELTATLDNIAPPLTDDTVTLIPQPMQIAAGSNSSLTGQSPALVVEEMQSGRPSYTASYQPAQTGPYQVAVTQLLPGGLSATYWDNAWLFGSAAVQRVDAQVSAAV